MSDMGPSIPVVDATVRSRIQKLLALSESPNESEAQLALEKARELVARHSLSDEKSVHCVHTPIHEVSISDISYSPRRDPWIETVAATIAPAYRCVSFYEVRYGKQTRIPCFAGYAHDLDICTDVFRYALQYIRSQISMMRGAPRSSSKQMDAYDAASYALGFCRGLADAFGRQDADAEWAVTMVVPEKVRRSVRAIPGPSLESQHGENDTFARGVDDGSTFARPEKRLSISSPDPQLS